MNESTRLLSKNECESSFNSAEEKKSMNDVSITGVHRHLTLIDLISIGLASTVGSGIFVLIGFIAHEYAGPASILSWGLAGCAALLSGVSYAELAATIPGCGSSYLYVYKTMGETFGVIAGACLSLEYLIAASAVARAWGDKVVDYFDTNTYTTYATTSTKSHHYYQNHQTIMGADDSNDSSSIMYRLIINPGYYSLSVPAFIVSAISVVLLLKGVKESKFITNLFTLLKMFVVLFMIIGALLLFQPKNNQSPFLPKDFGATGVLTGATSSFFGYLGFDEVCCLTGEAVNPRRDIPRAVLITIIIITVLYMTASFALTGMQPYQELSEKSGFSQAFRSNGYEWAAQFTIIGELVTLPVVVLVTIMAQPRLQYAMALDKLLPDWMAETDQSGNLVKGTGFCGVIMVFVATFVPFKYLDDTISAGVLVAFCLTSTALILIRHDGVEGASCRHSDNTQRQSTKIIIEKMTSDLKFLLIIFNCSCFLSTVLWVHTNDTNLQIAITLVPLIICILMDRQFPHLSNRDHSMTVPSSKEPEYFSTPGVPYFPCLSIWLNWYLVAQLSFEGLGILMIIFIVALFINRLSSLSSDASLHGMEMEEHVHLP